MEIEIGTPRWQNYFFTKKIIHDSSSGRYRKTLYRNRQNEVVIVNGYQQNFEGK